MRGELGAPDFAQKINLAQDLLRDSSLLIFVVVLVLVCSARPERDYLLLDEHASRGFALQMSPVGRA